jgi:signal transduction histidine kinase
MSISTTWFLLDAVLGMDPAAKIASASFIVETAPVRLVFASVSAAAIFYVLSYVVKQNRLKSALKASINHYVRNELTVLTLALDLYQADPTPEAYAALAKATEGMKELVKDLDGILKEKKELLVTAA